MYYGVVSRDIIYIYVNEICDMFPNKECAKDLILGTIAVETDFANTQDKNTYSSGVGLCQFDKIGFDDVRIRTPRKTKYQILEKFGVNIELIEHRDLAHNPFLSILWCRLFYRLIPENIPCSLGKQAEYWKKHYNTEKGKGTVEKYIEKYNKYILPE